jgi:uncharacterized protein (TIGR00255 family)
MLMSMTGYGRSEISNEKVAISIELKSLNSRYFEFVPRLPGFLTFLEDEASRLIKSGCIRGRITLSVKREYLSNGESAKTIDLIKFRQYRDIVSELAAELGSNEELSLADYLQLPDIISSKKDINEPDITKLFCDGLNAAITKLKSIRLLEGNNLKVDIESRLNSITKELNEIELMDQEFQSVRFDKYKERVSSILNDLSIDTDRLYQEIAIQVEKRDITEELVRMKSHLQLFSTYFDNEDPVGKTMNFLLQEMNREMNTIGSKTDNHDISHLVVNIKNELERIREQVQNIL